MGFLGLLAAGRSAARDKSDKENALQQAQQFQAIKFGQDRELAQSQIAENNARTDALRNPPVKPTPPRIQLESREDGTYLVNLDTGEANKINVPGVKKTVQPHNIDPLSSEGIAAQMKINAAKPASTAGSQPSEGERTAAGLLSGMTHDLDILLNYKPTPSQIAARGGLIGQYWARHDPQTIIAVQAAKRFIMNRAYAVSGQTVRPDEAEEMAKNAVPYPWEAPEVQEAKRQALRDMYEGVKIKAGRAVPTSSPPDTGKADKPGNITLGTAKTPGQLWDDAVKLHGEAKVLAEFGPRPEK